MERTPFAIDDVKDDEEDDEDFLGDNDHDDEVMDEVIYFPTCHITSHANGLQVDAFLEAHDSGLTDADKAVANGKSAYAKHLLDLTGLPFRFAARRATQVTPPFRLKSRRLPA